MSKKVKVGGCQLPEVRGDIHVAFSHVLNSVAEAESKGVELLVFPECYLQGYNLPINETRDLALDLESAAFQKLLNQLKSSSPVIVLGLIEKNKDLLFNTAVVIRQGQVVGRYRKSYLLKNEYFFEPGNTYPIFNVNGLKFGINICNDLQFADAAAALFTQGADLIAAPCNNMLDRGIAEKWKHRHYKIRAKRAIDSGLWILSSDVTGDRDGKTSYGPTALIDPAGKTVKQVPLNKERMFIHEVPCSN